MSSGLAFFQKHTMSRFMVLRALHEILMLSDSCPADHQHDRLCRLAHTNTPILHCMCLNNHFSVDYLEDS